MCGFLFCIHNSNLDFSKDKFVKNLNNINHRGPDSSGYEDIILDEKVLKFGHKRLAINELSDFGNQPIHSFSGRFLLIYNGEIYNHNFLRKKYEKLFKNKWLGRCDSETLINLFEILTFENILKEVEGQFSFVVYDKKKKLLLVSRDIAGEKPLYILSNDKYLCFASDLIAFNDIPYFQKKISNLAFTNYLKFNYIPNPSTIFDQCFKLPAASYLEIDVNKYKFNTYVNFNSFISDKNINYSKYWHIDENVKNNDLNLNNHIENVELILQKSVNNQLLSDVPLGVLLSGGIDSTLVTALTKNSIKNVTTFNIGFDYNHYDESKYASSVSKILSTNHISHVFSKNDVINILPKLPSVYSEPFADSSALPTLLVSKIASNNVKVVLSGDGGDELFGGYNRYIYANNYWKYFKFTPKKIINLLAKYLYRFIGKADHYSLNRILKILLKLQFINNEYTYYSSLTSEWLSESNITSIDFEENEIVKNIFSSNEILFQDKMMIADFLTYLPDDILCKVDRASMFESIESRAPFLSKDIINYSHTIPVKYKMYNKTSKYILREILKKYIPDHIINRPKQGFGVPLAEWIRDDLKEWIIETLSLNNCKKHGLFNYSIVQKTLDDHFEKKINNQHKIWSLVQFNQWYNESF